MPTVSATIPQAPVAIDLADPVVVSPKVAGSEYGYVVPPQIQIVGTSGLPLSLDALCAQCGKAQQYAGDALPEVAEEAIRSELRRDGRRLVAVFDTDSFIRAEYGRAPHGFYRGLFRLANDGGAAEQCKPLSFNYVYQENFGDLGTALSGKTGGFRTVDGVNGGLEISKSETGNRFVYAYLNQEFDFQADFCISGFFTMEPKDAASPCSLDISLCDRWGEKVSVIFADGPVHAFTIKKAGEIYGDPGVTAKSQRMRVGLSGPDARVPNFFKISFWRRAGQTRCSLYLQPETPLPSYASPVHERIIDTAVFAKGFAKVHFKLWKCGVVRLYDFEIAELPTHDR